MAYIGNSPANVGNYQIVDDISSSFNGTTASFALASASQTITPVKSGQLLVSVNGVLQEPDDTGTNGFKVSGSNIVFSAAPASGSTFWCVYQGQNVDIGTPSNDTVGTDQLSATGTASSTKYLRGDNTWATISADVVDDTTPQLGGNLDLNSKNITGTGNIDVTGNVISSGGIIQVVRTTGNINSSNNIVTTSWVEPTTSGRTTITLKSSNPYLRVIFVPGAEMDGSNDRLFLRIKKSKNSGSYSMFGREFYLNVMDTGAVQGTSGAFIAMEQVSGSAGDTFTFSFEHKAESGNGAKIEYGQNFYPHIAGNTYCYFMIEEIGA